MNRLKLTVGVVLIFVAGALAGSLGMSFFFKQQGGRLDPFGPPLHKRSTFFLQRLTEELDLTEEQRAEIEKIVLDAEEAVHDIRESFLPQIKEVNEKSFDLMKEELDGGQREKLEQVRQRLRSRHARVMLRSCGLDDDPEQIISRMKEHIRLTQEQEAQVLTIVRTRIEEQRKLAAAYKDGAKGLEFLSVKEEMEGLRKEEEERLSAVLSKEQMAQYRKIRDQMRPRPRRGMPRHGPQHRF